MKVLFFPRWYPTPEDPMFGLFVQYHAEALRQGAEVAVMYVFPGAESQESWTVENSVSVLRRSFVSSGTPILSRLINPIRFFIAQLRAYRKVCRTWGEPDICHIHVLTRTGLLPLLLKMINAKPYIITEHWSRYLPGMSSDFKGPLRQWLTRLIVRHAAAVTTVTRFLGDAMKKHGLSHPRFHTVPNVVDTDRFVPAAGGSVPFTFLHVSCFDEQAKNIRGFLRSVSVLLKTREDFRVMLVGDGRDFAEIVEFSNKLGLHSVVTFTGLLTGPDLVSAYQSAGCLVLFSNYETQGVVILEAFACGIPVIATNTGGIPEVMDPSRGFLVEPGNEEELTAAMDKMLNTAKIFDAGQLSNYIHENFSSPVIASRFLTIYQQALENR